MNPRPAATEAKVVLAKTLHADKSLDIDGISKALRLSRSTLYRYVRLRHRGPIPGGLMGLPRALLRRSPKRP